MIFRSSRGLFAAYASAAFVALAVSGVRAGDCSDTTDKGKIKAAAALAAAALKKHGDTKLEDAGALGNGGSNVDYEDTRSGPNGGATFNEAADQLVAMAGNGHIIVGAGRSRGTVDLAAGIDGDVILINKLLLADICNPAKTPVERMVAKLGLGGTLANELAHVFQAGPIATGGAEAMRCDMEHDSDVLSGKALQPLLDALNKPDGTPHTSLDDIGNDAQAVAGLKKCMQDAGISTAVDIAAVQAALIALIAHYAGRAAHFATDIASGTLLWSKWYYSGHDAFPEALAEEDDVLQQNAVMNGIAPGSTRTFTRPSGEVVVVAPGGVTLDGRVCLVMASSGAGGARSLTIWRDDDADGLPEPAPIATVALPASAVTTVRAIYDMEVHHRISGALHSAGLEAGFYVVDHLDGSLFLVEQSAGGTPSAPARLLFQSPALATRHLINRFLSGPATQRLVFADEAPQPDPVVWFDVDPAFNVTSFLAPGQTAAMARLPANLPGADRIADFTDPSQIKLGGNPGVTVEAYSIGRGSTQLLAAGTTDAYGNTGSLPLSSPVLRNDLFMFIDPLSGRMFSFLPRLGTAIDHVMVDETGDGAAERVQLTRSPPRLHVLTGAPKAPSQFQHQYEAALEADEYIAIEAWGPGGRVLATAESETSFFKVDAPAPFPLYAQRAVDFSGDAIADEGVALLRFTQQQSYLAFFLRGVVSVNDGVDQTLNLPFAFEPADIIYADLNNDSRLDVRITEAFGGPPVCLINTGAPAPNRFVIGPCPAPPCCAGNADKQPGEVNFGDITATLANFNAPTAPDGTGVGDGNCDGSVNFADITSTLANFLSPCD